jgi:hypothetical protein
LVNQQAANLGDAPVGFLNPAIYAIGKGSNQNFSYSACFNDTTSGDNFWSGSPAKYPAVAGFDLCTGWGTPSGRNLINALAPDNFGITPNSGFTAVGAVSTTFSPSNQIFSLTNSGFSTFNWSVINTSAWLDVSTSGGTLPVGMQTNLTVSLNSAASSLPLGNYFATVTFSNQLTGLSQERQFTLRVIEPLQLLTTNGLAVFGPAGGQFYPASQNVLFTNLGAASVNWSIVNTSVWLSASSISGSLSGNSGGSVTISTNAATTALANGNYNATLLLSNQSSHVTQGLSFTASIGQSLVQNGGFETGNFNSWTLSGNSSSFAVSATSTYVHSGSYGLNATANSLGYITQNLPTVPGQTYQLSFWFLVTGTRPNQAFQANWNGATAYSTASPPTSWTNQKLIVTATSTNTALQFGLNSASTSTRSFALDEISVTPVNLPTITQSPVSQTNLISSNIVFTAAASGTATLNYQWRTNGVNLVNGGIVSGANTATLTLTGITTKFCRQLYCCRHQRLRRHHEQRGITDSCSAANHHQFNADQSHASMWKQHKYFLHHRRRHSAVVYPMANQRHARSERHQFYICAYEFTLRHHHQRCRCHH